MNTLAKIESWMRMTCEGCAMNEKINPLIDDIKKILDSEASSQGRRKLWRIRRLKER